MKYLLTIIYLFFTTTGITLMKLGGDTLNLSFNKELSFKIGWITFLGFLSYFISFLLWQKMLVKYDLSIMVPIVTGISQIIIIALGIVIFKESFNIQTLLGSIIIVIGILIMSFTK